MIHIIHEILVLIKNHLNYLKHNISESFSKKHNRLLFIFQKIIFSQHTTLRNARSEQEKIIKDVKKPF